MNQSIAKVENPRFLQSVLSKYSIRHGEPQVPMALVRRESSTCDAPAIVPDGSRLRRVQQQ